MDGILFFLTTLLTLTPDSEVIDETVQRYKLCFTTVAAEVCSVPDDSVFVCVKREIVCV